jgi:hypothetical protein
VGGSDQLNHLTIANLGSKSTSIIINISQSTRMIMDLDVGPLHLNFTPKKLISTCSGCLFPLEFSGLERIP